MSSTTQDWRTNNTAVNGSDRIQDFYCITMTETPDILTVIIALVGMAGNGTVLWLLGFRMHRNAFSVYILNLAGADFLFLCFQTGFSLARILYYFHKIINRIPSFFIALFNFAYLADLSMLTAISTERCLSVLWPIWYRCQRPRHTSAVMCALLWTLSLLLSFLEAKACGIFDQFDYSWCVTLDSITFAWLIVLLAVLSGSSLALLVRIFCSSRRMPVTRLYVTIAFTVLIFLLCGLPFGIYWFSFWLPGFYRVLPCFASEMTQFLSCVNSSANPIIYFLVGSVRHRRFQCRTLKQLLQRAMQDTPEEEEGGEEGNHGEQEAV